MTGGSAWCSLETASHVSEKIFSTNDSLKPELMCSFINWTTWPSRKKKGRNPRIRFIYSHVCCCMCGKHQQDFGPLCFGNHVRGVGKGGQIITNSGLSCFKHQTGVQKVFPACIPRARKNHKVSKAHSTIR